MRTTDRALARVIFIGSSGVGKTSIISRVTTGVFLSIPTATVGAGVRPLTFASKGQTYKFHLWDTAGQEVYRSLVPLYFKQATCALVVFSVASSASFAELDSWLDLLYAHTNRTVPAVVVANKTDLTPVEVTESKIREWADLRKLKVFYTSALSGAGLDALLDHVATLVEPVEQSHAIPQMQTRGQGCCRPS
jgi:small GTP-binding protein